MRVQTDCKGLGPQGAEQLVLPDEDRAVEAAGPKKASAMSERAPFARPWIEQHTETSDGRPRPHHLRLGSRDAAGLRARHSCALGPGRGRLALSRCQRAI